MKVILLENVKRIGSIGEVIDVKRGFARNYLISNKKALYASKENIKEVEKIKSELSKKDQEKKKNAKQIYESLKNKTYEVKKLTTENNDLYGSIKPTEISKIAVGYIDLDMFEPTRDALIKISPKIVKNGVIICEDPVSTPGLIETYIALKMFLETEEGSKYSVLTLSSVYVLIKNK